MISLWLAAGERRRGPVRFSSEPRPRYESIPVVISFLKSREFSSRQEGTMNYSQCCKQLF